MNDDGFTLVEMLVAMAIIGLSIGGLSLGLQVLSRYQRTLAETGRDAEGARAAEAAVERLLDAGGPFRSRDPARLVGTSQGFEFDCAQAARCAVELRVVDRRAVLDVRGESAAVRTYPLGGAQSAAVTYRGSQTSGAIWPPEGEARQTLRSIAIEAGSGAQLTPVLSARIWREQPVSCAFDTVVQDCR